MNFHDKGGMDEICSDTAFRYRQAPRHVASHGTLAGRALIHAAAPVFGSQLVFPRRFDKAVSLLLRNPGAATIRPRYAAHYFGAALHLDVDPASLVLRISDDVIASGGKAKWMGDSFLDGADWSEVLSPIDESPVHREMCELVRPRRNYRRTRTYRRLLKGIKAGRPAYRHGALITTTEDIDSYIAYCRDLIESAQERGVVRHTMSGAFHRLRLKHRHVRSVALDFAESDIGVAIGPDGAIVRLLGGKHRTAIAQALQLPRLPVEIRLVHVRWIAEQMRRTGLPAHLALKQGVSELRAAVEPSS